MAVEECVMFVLDGVECCTFSAVSFWGVCFVSRLHNIRRTAAGQTTRMLGHTSFVGLVTGMSFSHLSKTGQRTKRSWHRDRDERSECVLMLDYYDAIVPMMSSRLLSTGAVNVSMLEVTDEFVDAFVAVSGQTVVVISWCMGGSVVKWLGRWTCDFPSRVQFQAMILPSYFWDRWLHFVGKLYLDITTTQINLALHPSGVTKSSTSFVHDYSHQTVITL